ncbi:hypothetical protein [Actinoplanes teichomyceticus]|uniref:Uncharacterized protein n=1 Tax=Actinoplanes teichomyceticus TaxID=1867 RepID=A0A561WAV2_ACTTI|nr:hypothetical protein [Actinoplanes teichomyceticus]TWG20994.1 hypothetical protein FHX34_103523 [Actinoplanes teichomyceticus]GIF14814.1 hypothetical protein Ate01nite_48460 [Actinoplanes teichomyceticus]
MNEFPNDSRGDVQVWGLTHAQAARYHARLGTFWARRARRQADSAMRATKIAAVLLVPLTALLLLLLVAAAVGGW